MGRNVCKQKQYIFPLGYIHFLFQHVKKNSLLQNRYAALLYIFLIASLTCKSQEAGTGYSIRIDSLTKKHIYTSVDEMPKFIGKEGDILHYISKNYRDSMKVGTHFSLVLRFVIDSKGNLIGAGLTNKERDEYNEIEARIIDIVKSSPKWKPGKYSKKRINVLMVIKFMGYVSQAGKLDRVWTTGFICPRNLHEK